jgi:hypothetical protein
MSQSLMKDMQARYALSSDDHLVECGEESHIEYAQDYFNYLEYLDKGRALGKIPVRALFDHFNEKFFKHKSTARNGTAPVNKRHDDIMSGMHMMEEANNEEDADLTHSGDEDDEYEGDRERE